MSGDTDSDDSDTTESAPTTPFSEPDPPADPDPNGPFPQPFGRYLLLELLGQGGMGAVYLAQDVELDRRVALKVPHRRLAAHPAVRELFLHEARAAARLEHPGVCQILDVGTAAGLPYLTMRHVPGGRLAVGGPWEPRCAAEVVRDVARAMAYAHSQGVIHRDLKPSNILVESDG